MLILADSSATVIFFPSLLDFTYWLYENRLIIFFQVVDFNFFRCTTVLDPEGNTRKFTAMERQSIVRNIIEVMASDGLRTIGLAYRDFDANNHPDWDDESQVVSNLTLIGITGIEDPVRPEVRFQYANNSLFHSIFVNFRLYDAGMFQILTFIII